VGDFTGGIFSVEKSDFVGVSGIIYLKTGREYGTILAIIWRCEFIGLGVLQLGGYNCLFSGVLDISGVI
jgi:hypothetical protein